MKDMSPLKLWPTLIAMALYGIPLAGAEGGPIRVTGNVIDEFTHQYLKDVHVAFYHLPDSMLADSITIMDLADTYAYNAELYELAQSHLSQKERTKYVVQLTPGSYYVRCSHPDFETKCFEIILPERKYGRAIKEWGAHDIALKRMPVHRLKEINVNASRIKMITRGDTVVYDADAFQFSDGSMLDELIQMMPGLELRHGAEIYHDGVFVSELLLNGRNFFKGSPGVALANLPAYTVKDLRVYHRAPDDAHLRKNTAADTLSWSKALDVRLKRQFVKGWIANAEAAGGMSHAKHDTGAAYMGRLFGLRLTEHSHLGAYANLNNLNDRQEAGAQGTWDELKNEMDGISHIQRGGVNYNVDSKRTHVRFDSSLTGEHSINDVLEHTSSSTFVPLSDVFSRSRTKSHRNKGSLYYWSSMRYADNRLSVSLILSSLFERNKTDGKRYYAQFSADPDDTYPGAAIDSIFLPTYSPRLLEILINRLSEPERATALRYTINPNLSTSFRSPLTGNLLSVGGNMYFSVDSRDMYDRYDLQYAHLTDGARDFKNRYQFTHDRMLTGSVKANYEGQRTGTVEYSIGYNYSRTHESDDHELYRLDYIEKYGADTTLPLGQLPSMAGWRARCLDLANSFDASGDDLKHIIKPSLTLFAMHDRMRLRANVPVTRLKRHHTDTRATAPEITRHYTFTDPHLSMEYTFPTGMREQARLSIARLSLEYKVLHSAPLGSYLMDFRDDTDPLRVQLGNSNLKTTSSHQVKMMGRVQGRVWFSECHIDYNRTVRAVAQGMNYDAATGIYSFRTENVDGNWNAGMRLHLTARSAHSPFSGNNILEVRHLHSVDLVSTDGIMDAVESVVDNRMLTDQLRVKYQQGRFTAGLNATIAWNYATSSRIGFMTRSTTDLQEGMSLSIAKLFGNFNLHTDFDFYHRLGYDDASMNDHALVWNVQLSHRLDRAGRWLAKLHGYDLLRQLSSVRRTLNAQGLTEVRANTLPSYFMLHVVYQFNKKPVDR